MKRILQSAIFRALCAIITGVLLVMYNQDTLQWMTIVVGIIFFVSGVISCVAYFALKRNADEILENARKAADTVKVASDTTSDAQSSEKNINNTTVLKPSVTMPIVGIASMVLGAMLVAIPNDFHVWFIYILSAMLVIGALGQMFTLITSRKHATVGWAFWILPIAILLASIVVIVKHSDFSSTELILGLTMLVYGCTEIFNAIALHRLRKIFLNQNPITTTENNENA